MMSFKWSPTCPLHVQIREGRRKAHPEVLILAHDLYVLVTQSETSSVGQRVAFTKEI